LHEFDSLLSLFKTFSLKVARYREEESAPQSDKIGAALCSVIVAFSSAPYPLFISCVVVILEFDPLNYIFEAHILPDPTEREIVKHIIIPFALRLFVAVVVVFEGTRSLFFFFVVWVTLLETTTNGLFIVSKQHTMTHIFPAYQQYQLMNQMAESLTGFVAALWLAVGHVSTVVLLWLTVYGYSKTSYILLYVSYPLIALCIMATGVIAMKHFVAVFELSNETVCNWRAGCVVRVSRNGTFELRINKSIRKTAKSLKPVGFTVGKMKVIKKEFQMDWLSLLVDHLTNAVLLIKP